MFGLNPKRIFVSTLNICCFIPEKPIKAFNRRYKTPHASNAKLNHVYSDICFAYNTGEPVN